MCVHNEQKNKIKYEESNLWYDLWTPKKSYDTSLLILTMVNCPKCGNNSWTNVSCITISEEYLKSMKENSSSYKYGSEHPDWADIARVGNFIMEFQCRKCKFTSPEICY